MNNFNEETLHNIGAHLWEVEFALEGLSGLFRSAGKDGFLEQDEIYGVSLMVILIKDEMRKARRALLDQNIDLELKEFISEEDLERIEKIRKKKKKSKKKAVKKKKKLKA